MKKSILLPFLLLYLSTYSQSIEKVVYDKTSNTPVIFASVITDKKGVITNEEGIFKLNTQYLNNNDTITISSLGYEDKKISIENAIKVDTIFLNIQQQMLDDVVLSSSKLSARQIIEKFIDSFQIRHQLSSVKLKVFSRFKQTYTPEETNFELDRTSFMSKSKRKNFNEKIEKFFNDTKGSTSVSFKDELIDAFYMKDSTAVNFIKSTYLINQDDDKSTESIQKEVFKELIEAIDKDSSFKVRTGIIPVEDSLSTKEFMEETNDNKKDTIKNRFYKKSYPEILRKSQQLNELEFFKESKKYNFTLENTSSFNGNIVYVISFEPDRSSVKYKGTAYINAEDFGLLKLDYQLIDGAKEAGMNLKFLLGIKYRVDRSKFQYLFKKDESGKYYPFFYKSSFKNYIYFDRSFVFKENTDKDDRIKFKLSLLIESNSISEDEYLVLDYSKLTDSIDVAFDKNGYIFEEKIDRYNPESWEEYDIIQATEEIKNYNK